MEGMRVQWDRKKKLFEQLNQIHFRFLYGLKQHPKFLRIIPLLFPIHYISQNRKGVDGDFFSVNKYNYKINKYSNFYIYHMYKTNKLNHLGFPYLIRHNKPLGNLNVSS